MPEQLVVFTPLYQLSLPETEAKKADREKGETYCFQFLIASNFFRLKCDN